MCSKAKDRPTARLTVAGLFETNLGMPAYLHIDALHELLQERPRAGTVAVLLDENREAQFFEALDKTPRVSAVTLRRAAVTLFYETLAEHLMVFISLFGTFACALGFGVAYNSARIALSERGRELATLRVLGFTRGEVSYILLGEVGLLTVVALPLGCLLGYGLSALMARAFDTELFRIPLQIDASTYGNSMVVAIAACALSAVLVRRRIDTLDLIEVLKTRE